MSPALKPQQPASSLPLATVVFTGGAGSRKKGNLPREQRAFIEDRYAQAEPDIPTFPGLVTVAILVSASALSWFAVIALVRALVS